MNPVRILLVRGTEEIEVMVHPKISDTEPGKFKHKHHVSLLKTSPTRTISPLETKDILGSTAATVLKPDESLLKQNTYQVSLRTKSPSSSRSPSVVMANSPNTSSIRGHP
eukprot:NODE_6167_length_918_cov_31.303145_g5576_i0.p1 GENE.NODE_6167_length_918_cov_31.303145_g5576_i0~~NODE_6167_length_918_cov_31.303145_g5576_i0.p1  ORF type:complete len:110 (+),score=21.32 NODE_6167_length_918_cov_31.303145_g5576_i0:429-758(+)